MLNKKSYEKFNDTKHFLMISCFAKLGAQSGNLELIPFNSDEYIQSPGNAQFVGVR